MPSRTIYEIRVRGHLGAEWTAWFDGLTVTEAAGGETVLAGHVADQAELHAVLRRIRDTGLSLVALQSTVDVPRASAPRDRRGATHEQHRPPADLDDR